MKCPKCGKVIANDSNFCEFCGNPIKKSHKKIMWIALAVIFFSIIIIVVLSGALFGEKVSQCDDVAEVLVEETPTATESTDGAESVGVSSTRTSTTSTATESTDGAESVDVVEYVPKDFEVGSYYSHNGEKGIVYKVSGDKLHGQYFSIEQMEYTWDESYKMAEEAGGRLASYNDMQLIGRNFDLLDAAARKHLPYSLSQLGAVWIRDERNESIFFNKEDRLGEGELPGYPGGIGEFELLYPVFVFDF